MTDLQSAAYVMAQAVAAAATLESMNAANRERESRGHALAYNEAAFAALKETYCLSHDAMMKIFEAETTIKFFQIRDDGTHIPVMAIRLIVGENSPILHRAGFAAGTIHTLLTNLATMRTVFNPVAWLTGRTLQVAHQHINENWSHLMGGQVIDVEFVLGETSAPKEPE